MCATKQSAIETNCSCLQDWPKPIVVKVMEWLLKLACKTFVVIGSLLLYGVCLVMVWTIGEVWSALTSQPAETVTVQPSPIPAPVVAKQAPVILADARLFVRILNDQAKQEALQ